MKAFLLNIIIVLICISSFSQEKRSDEIIDFEGARYYKHEVVKGQTLYAVSQLYEADINLIKSPLKLKKVLKPGDILYVPVDKTTGTNKYDISEGTSVQEGQVFHEVKKGDTFYSLTDYYKITKDKLIQLNPFLVKGLKIGQVLKVPVPVDFKPKGSSERVLEDHQAKPVLSKSLSDSLIQILNSFPLKVVGEVQSLSQESYEYSDIKDSYKIGVMFPFMANRYSDKFSTNNTSIISLKIYEGLLTALDSLRASGMNIECFTYDTENDSLKVVEILNDEEVKSLDLVFGPLFLENYMMVQEFCNEHRINLINLISANNLGLLGSSQVFKANPSKITTIQLLAKHIFDNDRGSEILIISRDDKKETYLRESFLNTYNLLSRLKFGAEDSNFSVITSERPRLWKLEEKLSIAKSNVIVLPSTNKVFTSDVLTKLNTFREDYDIKLYAFDKIKEYDNIDVAYFENLDVHLLTNFLVTDTMRFEVLDQAFQKEYRSSLDRFSLLGYNLGNYFGKALYLYGDNFHDKLSDFSFNGLGYNFDYIKTGFENGYENKSLKFTKYSNFNFVPIN